MGPSLATDAFEPQFRVENKSLLNHAEAHMRVFWAHPR